MRVRLLAVCAGIAGASVGLAAHPMSSQNATFVQGLDGMAIGPFMYLGAKHMITGYDHLLFLAGVIYLVSSVRQIVWYVSLFTIGHSLTLLLGVLGGLRADPYLIDAVIGASVVYKAFENIGGFEQVFGRRPNMDLAVFVFGLFHGLGLSTRLQDYALSSNGLVANILSFNVGVEIGQVLALTALLIGFAAWRPTSGFRNYTLLANTALMTAGFLLVGYHLSGYSLSR